MPKISLGVTHALSQDEAVQRLKESFHTLKTAYQEHISSLEEDWKENSMDFRLATSGVTVTGTVTAEPSEVKVDAHLPMIAMMFKGTIESQIRQRLGQILA